MVSSELDLRLCSMYLGGSSGHGLGLLKIVCIGGLLGHGLGLIATRFAAVSWMIAWKD